MTGLIIAAGLTYLLLDKYLPLIRVWRMPQVGSRFRTDP